MKTISFHQFSLEEDAQWTKSASEHIFRQDLHIPLTTKMIKRALKTNLPRVRVFHVTNPMYFNNMLKMQGKKKSISALTRAHHEIVKGGINVSGGLVFELKADVLISAPYDIMSRPDKTGRRWLEFHYLDAGSIKSGKFLKGEIENYGLRLKQELIAKYNPNATRKGPVPLSSVPVAWSKLDPRDTKSPLQMKIPYSLADSIPGLRGRGGQEPTFKEIRTILHHMVKDYIDAMEKIVVKYAKDFSKLFFAHSQNAAKEMQMRDGYDELVVNNYKIKQVLLHEPTIKKGFSRKDEDIQEEQWGKLLERLDELGIDYEVFENASDISREIAMRSNLDFL